jgi:putative transcriptional regulator
MSTQGQFLVASPYLGDPNFNRSVVLMITHHDEGALGLVLNRPMNNTVRDILRLAGETECDCVDPIYYGGPVQGPLVAVHTLAEQSEAEIVPGVYFSAHKDHIRAVVDGGHRFRLFSGYSGWGEGQLDGELDVGGWLTTPATAELIFLSHDEQWQRLMTAIERDILGPALRDAPLPDNPSLN